ncbi:polycystic kidney disease 1 like 1 [Periophthalmus magnuspinnatus]|uniref:polycystic kidney disease 1 like 1 n=1 Tax=Periophthalmus magnuspinnatus TaxID=409849 RepID=UPI002436470C|nr:polycystic kidney disease 1 like 1 [Periophthalmus magnuspinnatus]
MRPGFAFSVWSFLSLRFSAAVSLPSGRLDSWFLGCASGCSGLSPDSPVYSVRDSADLDPVHCSARCHRRGCSVAAVSSGGCYCGNQELLTCPFSDCPNNFSKHVPRQRAVSMPVGAGKGNVALYQTRGPFLNRIHVSVSPDLVFAGTTFTVHVSGNLAAPLDQSTGIFGLGRQDFSDVTVEFLGMTPKGQSSLHVNILDQGSFNVSSNWSLEAPGTYEIRVIAINILSMITATHNVSVLAQTAHELANAWLFGAPRSNGSVKVKPRVDTDSGAECDCCLTQGEETCFPKSVCISTQTVGVQAKKKRDFPQNSNVVEVYAAKQAYPTNTDVHLSALTDAQGAMEFLWRFGDSTSARNILKAITKRYRKPGRYNVTVVMVTPRMSITSEPFPVIIQRAVKLNRLIHQASVLQNQTVVFSCRVNTGTDLYFLWTFGDGSSKHGHSTEQHVFQSLGEFMVEVTVFNLVSSASLRSLIFVVDKPCQPPPVKNMGPLTVKVPRYEPVRLGVTYEAEFNCDVFVSGGVHYTWKLYNSMGQAISLPHIETHRQTLVLPSHFLHYDTYTAIAKVQVVGSVVYSNYSVKVQVTSSAPVAFIQGGTNVFINNKNTTVVTLDGTKSHDPDFPHNVTRFSWVCKPVSSIPSSCFDCEFPMSSAVISFLSSFLKPNFDQFQFTLTIESAGRLASADVFLTVKTDVEGKVSTECPQCQNNKVNWDESFSVQAFCEQCKLPSDFILYSWRLYQVNASSRPISEVPFCHTLDLSAPSAIKDTPTETSPSQRKWRSVLNPGPDSTIDFAMTSSGDDLFDPLEELDLFDSSPISPEHSGHQEIKALTETSSDWDFPFAISEDADLQNDPDYDPFLNTEEGEPDTSPGRTTVEDGEDFSLGEDLDFDPGSHREEGSNLVDVRPHVAVQERTLLDLPRDPVPQWIFESYTYTGISSPELNFKPFSLQPGSRYMLDVIATHNSQKPFLGRTQFFFQTRQAPKGMTCQVQPTTGVELLTVFSVFCTSGKEDLTYKYSYSVGNEPPQTLYQGTDFEHYFSLPLGDLHNDYKVTVSIEIRSSIDGGTTRPCPVSVTVQPQFTRDTYSSSDPVLELSHIAMKNLSSRLGNSFEILNEIRIVTNILNRLSVEPGVNMASLVFLRNALVCIICDIEVIDQFSALDTIHILGNLLQKPNQVSLATISKVTGLIANRQFEDQKTLNTVISLLAHNLKSLTTNMRFVLLHKMEEFKLSAGFVSVYSTYPIQKTTVSSGFSVFYLPQSFLRHRDACVIGVVTELNQNPYFWANYPGELIGPVVELNLFRCNAKRKIPIQFFAEPFEIEVQTPEKQTPTPEHILQHNKINYHGFNISHEHLQYVFQLHVQFTPPATRVFPVVLLFRMFAKPTPSEYHLRKIHHWGRSVIHMTLPSSFLSAGGVGYLTLLNADFERPQRWTNTKVSYRVRVDRSQCVSWDAQRGAWSTHNCKTQAKDKPSAVNCRCRQLYPVTVVQEQIPTNLDAGELGAFFSVSYNWTVLIVLVLGVALFIGALVLSPNADVASGERRAHYLSDNLQCEPHLYAVTIYTGLCSAPEMSAKVYIVLCGEDGFTQTKELQVPGCTLFRRNSQDTFIVGAAESLGSLCGIHIWHDNSGPTPTWYLKRVEVFEVNRDHQVKGRMWLFVSECWLAVDRSDGRVERMLRVYDQKTRFGKMLRLKVWDYMTDFHIWISVYSCPNLKPFTQGQRLSVCALLWLGYACVSTVIISQRNDKMLFELDVKELSMNAVTTGMLSVALVLPVVTLLSFMFRLSQLKIMRPATKSPAETKTEGFEYALNPNPNTNTISELYISWGGLQQWLQESWRKKYQDIDLFPVSSWGLDNTVLNEIQNNVTEDVVVIDGADENKDSSLFRDEKKKEDGTYKARESCQDDPKMPQWFNNVAWVLCLLFCVTCLASSAILGVRFTRREAVLWIQSLLFSLLFCIFFFHPLLVFTMALVVSMWHRKSRVILNFSTRHVNKSIFKAIQNWALRQTGRPTLLKLLEVRQRQRFLRLVRPPVFTELRKSRWNRKRDRLIRERVWDWIVFGSMFSLMLCITYESSSSDYYNLNKTVKKHFISDSFKSVRTYDEWWRWAQTSLLNALYRNTSSTAELAAFQNSHILIGEPVLWKTEALNSTFLPNCHKINFKNKELFVHTCSDNLEDLKMATKEAKTDLGHTKTIAELKLKQLNSEHWIGKSTVALKVHFALYSPAPNLFTSVTLTIKQSPFGILLPSASVQSVRVCDSASQWDYVVMTCKLLFLILLILRLCHHVLSLCEKGLFRHGKLPCNWLEVGVFVVAIVYHFYCIYRSAVVGEVEEWLQRQNSKTHIDFNQLATWDQTIRSLRGTLLFLLTLRCICLVNKTAPQTHSNCSLFWILVAGLIFVAAFSSMRRLVHIQRIGLHHGVISVITRLMWTALVINVVGLSVKSLRRRRNIFTMADLVRYIKKKLFSIWTRSAHIDHNIERKTYYFEQFESVLDELLFKLDALSDQTGVYREDSPISPRQDPSKFETQDFLELEMAQPFPSSSSETSGPQLDHLPPNGEKGDEISEGITLSNQIHHGEMKCDKNTEERDMDTLKGQFTLTSHQAESAEVIVEVLVHNEQ